MGDRWFRFIIVLCFVFMGFIVLYRENVSDNVSGLFGIILGIMLIQSIVIFDYEGR